MKTALFTGAGASRAIGYPLTREFLRRIRKRLEGGTLFKVLNDKEQEDRDCADLGKYLKDLLPGFQKVKEEDLPLVTDVFSLVEYALVSGEALAVGDERRHRRFRDLLKQAIIAILLDDLHSDWNDNDPNDRKEHDTQDKITSWIVKQAETFGLVTTNYDIGIEYHLYEKMGLDRAPAGVDLGFDWRAVDEGTERTRPVNPALRIYKLHGSLDLLRCQTCGYVYFNPLGTIAHQAFKEELDDGNTCHCRDDIRLELHIVPPSMVREVRDANLLSVWRSALEWMRGADRWIIVGYSLPPEDIAVRSLLLRAYFGAKKKPEIMVVQEGTDAEPRYKLLFPDCTYESDGLEAFLKRVDAH